ncbi:putative UvrD/REP helicase [Cafeteria roenbergensis virus]|uniref:DNA 3'-5' helicase n=1 Tax=Cafeteria roenbergensis virus (strain BV-PW1) TaxID=693272 RepID=E3T5J8_CROVB|nr:DNA helicase [Cafeteria roenbergensis virus BV-PW1]ADO67460.1 putative UvrD/REP helicase [Cafeteria roenbergensis virus BV-PW1]
MNEILKKMNFHQTEIYKLNKKLNQIKPKLDWNNYDNNQKLVIQDNSDVILVEAYPGSGKTHTLLGRVKRLVSENPLLLPKMIIITFTKKAGEELREKIKLLVPGGEPYFVGTFHGLAYRELSSLLSEGLSLLDQHDEDKLIKDVGINLIKKGKINSNLLPIINKYGDMAYQVSSTRYPIRLNDFCTRNGLVEYQAEFTTLIEEYEKEKEKMDLIDFNDVLPQFYLKLKNNMLNKLESIDYLFFDEYQDVNPIQNQILKELNNRGIHLMVVGDPRQSIYSFRGSEVSFINNFESEFPSATRFILPYNYRSGTEIVEFCNNIFIPKCKMEAKNDKIKKPEVKIFTEFKLEKKWVIDSIEEKHKQGCALKNMTILTRKNKILSHLETDLIRRKIPYLINGGVSLLEKAHIKDLISFMTLFFHSKQKFHWKRILMLHQKISIKITNKILDSCENLPGDLEKYQYDKNLESLFNLSQFMKKVKDFSLKNLSIEIINYLSDIGVNYNYPLEERETDYSAISQFLNDSSSFYKFLEEIYLERTLAAPNNEDYLEINSFHGSKGLEWDVVYLMGLNGSEIPHYHNAFFIDENNSIEEERRLFFVACSRAKRELYLSSSLSASWKHTDVVCPFLLEIPTNLYQGDILKNNNIQPHNVPLLVHNYLYSKGNLDIKHLLEKIKYKRINITKKFKIPTYLQSHYLPFIVGKFFNSLVTRMVWDDLDIDVKNWKDKINNKILNQDFATNWKENINHFWISSGGTNTNIWKEYLENIDTSTWIDFSKDFNSFIMKQKISDIEIYSKLNYKGLSGEMDIISDKFIVEIKTCWGESLTIKHLLQIILSSFINKQQNKNNIYGKVKKVLLYNPLLGEGIWLYKTPEWNNIAKKIIEFYCNY